MSSASGVQGKAFRWASPDSPENVERYLLRNPVLSFTAWHGDLLIGAVLCDTTIGALSFITWLLCRNVETGVLPATWWNDAGQFGVMMALAGAMCSCGRATIDGREFWRKMGWKDREDIALMMREIRGGPDALREF